MARRPSTVSLTQAQLTVLRKLWPFVDAHRPLYLVAFACMVVLGLTTSAFAYLLGPMLRFLLSGGTSGLGMIERVVPSVRDWMPHQLTWILPATLVVLAILKGAAYFGQFYGMGLLGQRVGMDVRRALLVRLCALSPVQRSRLLSGDLLSRFVTDAGAIETATIYALSSYVRDGLQIVLLIGVAVSMHWQLALAALVILPATIVPAARLTKSFVKRATEGQLRIAGLAARFQEGVHGIRVLQAFNAQSTERERFTEHAERSRKLLTKAAWYRGAVPALMELLAAVAVGGVIALSMHAQVPPEALISLVGTLVLIYQPAKDLGRVGQWVLQAAISGQRVLSILETEPEVKDGPHARSLKRVTKTIRFQDVEYGYGEKRVLHGVSFDIPVGQVTALVGPSGGGKSTVTSLLLGFERPTAGQIDLDGIPTHQLSVASWRAQFALVTQDSLLFSGSVLDNLRYARPHATLPEVEQAARLAHAHEFIERLPQGYDAVIGEKGVTLSGGQKQRLCLARALLSDAPVWVLDEATSNLDPISEREVQDALSGLLAGRSVFLIAHRLSAVVNADRILVLDEGKIVEEGTHAALLARQGVYAKLWALGQARGAAA